MSHIDGHCYSCRQLDIVIDIVFHACSFQAKEGGGLGGMGGGPKKKEEPKPEVAAPVVQKVGLKTPEKPKPNRGAKRKVEPPKIILSPLEVTDIIHSLKEFTQRKGDF